MIKFQPTLVNHSVLRAYGIEHPIGDPFSGAAYGDKHKGGSVLGGLGGVGSILAGVAVIASGGTLAPLMGGLMIAGGAMSTIGAVSGNSTLSKIGGITSMVGGIGAGGMAIYDNWGSITESVGSFLSNGVEATDDVANAVNASGNAAAAAGDTMVDIPGLGWNNAMAEGASTGAQMSMANTPAAFDAASIGGAYNGGSFVDQMTNAMADQIGQTAPLVSDSIAANVNPSNMLASTQAMTDAGGASLNSIGSTGNLSNAPGLNWNYGAAEGMSVPGSLQQSVAGASVFNPSSIAGGVNSTNYMSQFPGLDPSKIADVVTTVQKAGGGHAEILTQLNKMSSSSSGLLGSVGNFIKDNPMASMMGMQALSGLAEGASPKSQAEGEYLQAMTQLKEAEASYLQAAQDAKIGETQANTEYLQAKAAEFDKTKAYAEEKRKAYNDSIKNLQMPSNYVDYNNALFNPTAANTNAGIINGARA